MQIAKLIESPQNPEIKAILRLRKRRERDKTQSFLIEGYRELLRASERKHPIRALYVCPELFLGSNEQALISQIESNGAEIIQCSQKAFEKISYRDRPDGLLAIAPQAKRTLKDLHEQVKDQKSPLFIVAEAIEKPGNLGTILRCADAVGVDGVIIADPCTDLHNPNVVRASVGTLFTVPVVESNSEEVLRFLREHDVQTLAATPEASTVYTDANMSGPLAIIFGTEQLGLTDFWMNEADQQVRIPMNGCADSLNVAMATTVLMFEAARQRCGTVPKLSS